MAAVIGALRADLSASVAQFESDMGKAAASIESFGRRAQRISRNLESAGKRMTAMITAPFLAMGFVASREAAAARDALAQVESRLQSMGGASGKTSEELQATAKQLQRLSTYDDDDILRNVTNSLLTFGGVAGEQFDRAQRAAVDMATSLQMQLQPATVMIGKALNDPVRGITAMQRAGIQFTDSQKDMIKGLVESGQTLEAQNIILAELERQFQGAGLAARDAVPGSDMIDSWRDFQEVVGEFFLRAIETIEPLVVRILDSFGQMSEGMQGFIISAAAVAASIGPILWALGAFIGALANLAPFWAAFVKGIADAGVAAGVSNIAGLIRAVTLVMGAWSVAIGVVVAAAWEFRQAVVDAFSAVVEYWGQTFGPALRQLFDSIDRLFGSVSSGPIGEFVRFIGWVAAEVTGILVRVLGTGLGALLTAVVRTLTTIIDLFSDFVRILGALLTGDFGGALDAAGDMVGNFVDNIIRTWDLLIPGAEAAFRGAADAAQTWLADRMADVLGWIENRFPGLVDAVKAMAQGAVAWARHLYDGFKTWINDNLGPLIRFAQARIRELASLFAWIRRRQAQLTQERAAAEEAPPAQRPPPRPPADDDTSDAAGSGARSDADRRAKALEAATEKLREALEDVNGDIDRAFARDQIPRSMQRAAALRAELEDMAAEARAAGVDMEAFAEAMQTVRDRIEELEIYGLAEEAKEFARDVQALEDAITDFGRELPPLDDELLRIDRRFEDLRDEITEQIEANRILADSNDEAAAAMRRLEAQLARLNAAHRKAREGAEALYAAQERLRDLQAAAEAEDTRRALDDLRQRAGQGGVMSGRAQEIQRVERELHDMRMRAAQDVAEVERALIAARLDGDEAQIERLQTQLALSQELFDVISETTAEQITAAERIAQAFQRFTDGLSDELSDMILDWEFDLNGIRNVFKQIARDLWVKPFMESAVGGFSKFLSGFAGGFATGETLRPGQWGIAGEQGPEPIFAGAAALGVMSHGDAYGGGGGVVVNQKIVAPDPNAFRASRRQIARQAREAIGRSG